MTTMPRYYCEVDRREIELGEPVVWAAQQRTTKTTEAADDAEVDGAVVYFHKACWDAFDGKDNYRSVRTGTLRDVVGGS